MSSIRDHVTTALQAPAGAAANIPALLVTVHAATNRKIIAAGSFDTSVRICELKRARIRSFIIGGAVLEGHLSSDPALSAQLRHVLDIAADDVDQVS